MRKTVRGFVLLLTALSVLVPRAWAQGTEQSRIEDVVYGRKMGVALTMDVFKPAKPNGIGVIWIVSGGWYSSHAAINPGTAMVFTSRGDTVFEVVHGSQPRFIIPEIVDDIHRAVRFIRAHAADYGVDPDRLGIAGASAGGHLSLMIGAYGGPGDPSAKNTIDSGSSRVQAVACFFPATDFLNWGKEGAMPADTPNLHVFMPAFGINENTPRAYLPGIFRVDSPIYGVTDKMPPTLVIHGDADPLVPIQQSELLMTKLEELKVPHKLVVEKGKGHGWPGIEKDMPLLADWFDQYLKK